LYNKGVDHYMTSSEQDSACVVEPGTAEDVGAIVSNYSWRPDGTINLVTSLRSLARRKHHLQYVGQFITKSILFSANFL